MSRYYASKSGLKKLNVLKPKYTINYKHTEGTIIPRSPQI